MTPKQGMAVPEGFRLPWNTTRTMAQAWTPKNAKTHLKRGLNRLPGAHHGKR